ncbi:MAG: metallophosphoesterase [Gammaproteobacteria bacterium]|nr:metallophosphoesterase [Gammaproteobacteria bacterium]
MANLPESTPFPSYRGLPWIQPKLPDKGELWLPGKHLPNGKATPGQAARLDVMSRIIEQAAWKWPRHPVHFICDPHADTDAFLSSLVAAGLINKNEPEDDDFKLTRPAKKSRILIGGDCFDKGPSVLRLLRSIHQLSDRGARVSLLAGNHDVRTLVGIRSTGPAQTPHNEHFFARLGAKSVPLLAEISNAYLKGSNALRNVPGNRECRRRLFPSKRWFDEFPSIAEWMMPEKNIDKELKRLKEKIEELQEACDSSGLSFRQTYAAARKCEEIFLHKQGAYSWLPRNLHLAHRCGSFLFIHAGLNDRMVRMIADHGIKYLNREFRNRFNEDPFEFYYGPLANTIRTKYRPTDMPLTKFGVRLIDNLGIHAVVHGHRNLTHGQRIMRRKGMINFECDTSLDRNTRRKEGLKGHGASVTKFHPEGMVLGISNDYPKIKVFEPAALIRKMNRSRKP